MISMICNKPEQYVAMTSFGFSVEKLPSEELPGDFFQELTDRFTAAELPASLVENPLRLDGLNPVHACSLIEPGILENLSLDQPGLLRDCISGISRNIEQLAGKGILSGVLNFDMTILLSPERESLYFSILRGLANVLERCSFTILIPFPVPVVSREMIRQVSAFLRRCLLPMVKLRLDIHCHELSPGFSPEELAGILFPEIRSIRFLYLAEAGNVIVPDHVHPWIKALSVYGFRGPCFFTPVASNLNGLPLWVSANESLMAKLEK